LNDAFRDEAAAMTPGNSLMQRRLAREHVRRGHALGGSRTIDNMNDSAPVLCSQAGAAGRWTSRHPPLFCRTQFENPLTSRGT
jgi:hypothetical protein